ncbi:MAG: ribosome recycling factor [candidate division Zixibacteria bacterium]|nr:ribosome recycling factor [candidate division Zixibacteria bacterium]
MAREIFSTTEEKMKKTIEVLQKELYSIRTGKASISLLDGIKVEYYGSMVPLNQIATVSVPDYKLIIIQPWEKRLIPEIAKAIQKSDLGLNPLTDANVVRLPIPPLTEERRQDLVKHVKKIIEDSKISLRNIRREANEALKKKEKDKEISEDDSRKGMEQIQKILDKQIEAVEELLKKKEAEIMEV